MKQFGFELAEIEAERSIPVRQRQSRPTRGLLPDSCSNLNLPVWATVSCRYGLFRREIDNGFRRIADAWRELPYPFTVRREAGVLVRFNDLDVWAVPFDLPVCVSESITNT